ncbi:O-antigen ligase family protein [Thalassotalea nanhaiensis]|uniref:O-antigen ligase family protein n=1 Tax=Thalassotalea nanhaiensis TaxID=3065648 RepID=A0ABY9TI19_9GAMM|nr:O-antigen ligase family protein [Colwelliaceae bacterium SQ345]
MSISALIFIFLYVMGLIKAFTSKPLWGLFSYFVAFYMHPPSRWWGVELPDFRWSLIAAVITFIALIFNSKLKIDWLDNKESKLLLLFWCYICLQMFWAIDFYLHLRYIELFLKFILLFVLIRNCITNKGELIFFILINAIGCTYFGYLGLINTSGRLEGVGGASIASANLIAQHVAVILILSSYLLLCNLKKLNWLLIPLVIILLEIIMQTESRTVLISLFCIALFSLFYIPRDVKKQFIIYLSLGGILFFSLLGPQIIQRFEQISSNESSVFQPKIDRSALSRIEVIKAQLSMFKERPIIGYGNRGTLLLSPLYLQEEFLTKPTAQNNNASIRASHNLAMSMLVDHGLIGATIYFYLILILFLKINVIKNNCEVNKDDFFYSVMLLATTLSLLLLQIAGQGTNNKVLEVTIWLMALITLISDHIKSYSKVQINDK